MKYKKIPVPLIGLIAGTRGMLGAGSALLFMNRLNRKKRRKLGWTLFLAGAVSTIPLAYKIFRSQSSTS